MKSLGTVLLLVGVLALAASFGTSAYINSNMTDSLLMKDLTPEAAKLFLNAADGLGLGQYTMNSISGLILHVYAASPMLTKVGLGCTCVGGLMTLIFRRERATA